MDDLAGTLLSPSDLDEDPPLPVTVVNLNPEIDGHNANYFPTGFIAIATNNSTHHGPGRTLTDEEYTQTMSILAFSSLVLFAVISYIFSKHCLFKDKRRDDCEGGNRSTQQSPQFNFLGSRGPVRGIVATVLPNVPTAVREDDLPPAYDELFPPDYIIVDPRTLPALQQQQQQAQAEEDKPKEGTTKDEKKEDEN